VTSSPSYIVKNRHGTYYFQYRLPKQVQTASNSQKLFRISLRTKVRREALKQSKRWSIVMDELTSRFFDDPESFGKAMALLKQYKDREKMPTSWESMENFLMGLEKDEDHLLNQALLYNKAQSSTVDALKSENEILRNSLILIQEGKHQFPILEPTKTNAPCLSVLIQSYWNEFSSKLDPKHLKSNERDIIPKLNVLLEVVGDIPANEITKEHVFRFKSIVLNYPANRNKMPAYKDLSISEIENMVVPESDKLSKTTINNYLTKTSSFLTWCGKNFSHIANDLTDPLKGTVKKSSTANKERDEFSSDDLKKLFESQEYIQGTHTCSAHYWIPLLALFTGARENELCQLHTTDVHQNRETGCWVIHFNDDGQEKKLKKSSHSRMVPVHQQLIKMGFIDFVTSIKTECLFDELRVTDKGHGDAFSKWFNRTYRNERHCNVGQGKNEKKNFHSFRHTVITQLVNDHAVDQHSVARLVGQKPSDSSVTINRYTKDRSIETNSQIINKLRYSIDFNKIRRWKIRK
jgi:integrase